MKGDVSRRKGTGLRQRRWRSRQGQFAAGTPALTFRNIKREKTGDTGYIQQEILMISRFRYPQTLCLKHKVRSPVFSLFLQRTVTCLRCRKPSLPAAPSPLPETCPLPPGYVPFRWDTSPFIGIRPLSLGYVPFSLFSRSFYFPSSSRAHFSASATTLCMSKYLYIPRRPPKMTFFSRSASSLYFVYKALFLSSFMG